MPRTNCARSRWLQSLRLPEDQNAPEAYPRSSSRLRVESKTTRTIEVRPTRPEKEAAAPPQRRAGRGSQACASFSASLAQTALPAPMKLSSNSNISILVGASLRQLAFGFRRAFKQVGRSYSSFFPPFAASPHGSRQSFRDRTHGALRCLRLSRSLSSTLTHKVAPARNDLMAHHLRSAFVVDS